MLVLLLRTAFGRAQSVKSTSTLVGLFGGVATFWLGGSWATAKFVADLKFEQIRTPYFISSLAVMLPMSMPIAIRYLIVIAREAGRPLQPER
jgi:xanthine/uracil permease